MPKMGRSLSELASEIERQQATKRDFVASSQAIGYAPDGTLALRNGNGGRVFGVTDICHEQLASRLGIPRAYYDRMRLSQPDLLARNVNTWLQAEPKRYMVRTLDGKARALLSDRYRPLDAFDLAQAGFPALAKIGAEVVSCDLTERRLYVKAVVHKVRATVVGDIVEAGVTFGTSEVGLGSVFAHPYILKLSCLNGATMEVGVRKTHVGRSYSGGEDFADLADEYFKDETREASDRAFWMKVRDVIEACCSEERFKGIVGKIEAAAGRKIEKDPVAVIEDVTKRYGFTDDEKGGLLRHLISGGDLSQWGMANAITRLSQDVESYDRASDMERYGGQIIELAPTEWRTLAQSKN